mmetsp:Transcript_25795/g.74483  ORF Transcript_25795/g.74483 Transcript_25795/m.74483 type:complete len:829 (+) Transcript_25795:2-2488(+)
MDFASGGFPALSRAMSRPTVVRFRRCWRPHSARFSYKEEAAFKQSLHAEVVSSLLAFTIIGIATLLAIYLPVYAKERGRLDDPFSWVAWGPRLVYFGTALATLLALLLVVVACSLRKLGRLRCLNFEHVALILTLFVTVGMSSTGTIHHAASSCGADPLDVWRDVDAESVRTGELIGMFALLVCVFSLQVFIPICSGLRFLVPLVGAAMYPLMATVSGTTMPSGTFRFSLGFSALCFFAFVCGRRQEALARQKWRAQQDSQERELVARGLEQMSWLSCDLVLRLDRCGRVVNSEQRQDAFFGTPIQGRGLEIFLAEADRGKFSALLNSAKDTLEVQSMPAAFEVAFATIRTQVAVVCAGGAESFFLIGVSQVEHELKQEPPLASTMWSLPEDAAVAAEPVSRSGGLEAGPGGGAARGSMPPRSWCESDTVSVADSVTTARVFGDVQRLARSSEDAPGAEMEKFLRSMVDIGVREHWLVPSSDVEILTPSVLLGLGGFGFVAVGRLRGTPVAVKAPRTANSKKRLRTVASLCNELRLLRRVRHPHIAAFHAAVIAPGSGQLAMIYELVEGLDLSEYVNYAHAHQEPRRDARLLKVLVDVGSALSYLHTSSPSIVHCDIKASNVIVEELAKRTPFARVLDFGLSRLDTPEVQALGGTREWMAPELVQAGGPCRPQPAPSVDIYAFGLLMHFVLTAVHPKRSFNAACLDGRSEMLVALEPVDMGEDLKLLYRSCVAHDPLQRPTMLDAMKKLADSLEASGKGLGKLSPEVVFMLAPASPWDEGMEALSKEIAKREEAKEKRGAAKGAAVAHASAPPSKPALAGPVTQSLRL